MSSQPVSCVSPEEYLELERTSLTKNEFVYGQIIAMAGGTPRHSFVISNIHIALGIALRGKQCFIFNADLRVCVRWGDLITYPDVTAVCGALQYVDEKRDTLINPTFIVEVLSPSTKSFDRSEKARLYRMLPSLMEYLLVEPEPVEIEHYRRLPNGNWELATIRDREATLRLESLACEIPVTEIYRNVEQV